MGVDASFSCSVLVDAEATFLAAPFFFVTFFFLVSAVVTGRSAKMSPVSPKRRSSFACFNPFFFLPSLATLDGAEVGFWEETNTSFHSCLYMCTYTNPQGCVGAHSTHTVA